MTGRARMPVLVHGVGDVAGAPPPAGKTRSSPAAFGGGAIIGALGGLIGLGGAELFVASVLSLFVIIHQGSKLRRWENVEWAKLPFWLELWMCISMMVAGTLIWFISNLW